MLIVEWGDGQMAGLPESVDMKTFYKTFKTLVGGSAAS